MEQLPDSAERLAEMMSVALRGHGLANTRRGPFLSALGAECECRVFLHSQPGGRVVVQADVRVQSPLLEGGTVVESIAGYAGTEADAVKDAFRKLTASSLHVLLAAILLPGSASEQVGWEEWRLSHEPVRACLGRLLLLGPAAPTADSYGAFLDVLRDRHISTLQARPHWLRVYYCASEQGRHGGEVLLDNEPWPAGREELERFHWPPAAAWHSIRHFMMLLPGARRPTTG